MIELNKMKVEIKKNEENLFYLFVEKDQNTSQNITNNFLKCKIEHKIEYSNQHKQFFQKISSKDFILLKDIDQKGKLIFL
jgi:hypothetical protein